MFVVIDSNIIISQYALRNTAFKRFVKHFPEKNIDVYVSKVTVEEVIKNHRSDIQEATQAFRKARKNLNKHLTKFVQFPDDRYAEMEHRNYIKYLKSILRDSNIRLLDYPNIGHEEIVKYSNTGRKPFRGGDKGYKDFLIWNTIIELISGSSRKVVLLTHDGDFTDKTELHNDLKEHLKELSINEDRVEICKSFNDFNDKYLKDIYHIVQLKELFKKGSVQQDIERDILEKVSKELEGISLEDYPSIDLKPEYEDPTIYHVHEFANFEITSVEVLTERYIVINFSVDVGCRVDFYIDKHEFYFLEDDKIPEVHDYEWNEYYVWASVDKVFNLQGSVSSNKNAKIGTDFSIHDLADI